MKTNSTYKSIYFLMVMIASFVAPKFGFSQTMSQGTNNPSAVSEEFSGCIICTGTDWMNYMNAASADNSSAQTFLAQYPTCFESNCFCSRALKPSGFGFNIPGSAVITGIKAEVLRSSTDSWSLTDTIVRLMLNDSPIGTSHASHDFWSSIASYKVYGDSTDSWGANWSPADINATGFGLFYKIQNINPNISSVLASIDHVRLTVYYQTTTGVTEHQTSDNSFSTYFDASEKSINIRTVHLKSNHVDVLVFNNTGQLIAERNTKKNFSDVSIEKINADFLPAGIYFVELRTDDSSFSSKIIVTK